MTIREKIGLTAIISLCFIAFFAMFLIPPIPQDLAYHQFADQRKIFRVPNFWDVVSNIPFLIVGLLGIKKLAQGNLRIIREFKIAYYTLFVGVALVSLGSGYYHLWPDNLSLVWDRLPMTIAFMSLIAIITAEFVSLRLAKKMFWPLLLLGISSVIYWILTENAEQGDLRFYGLVQFLPMVSIPIVLLCFNSKFSHTNVYWWLLICYFAAKLFEHFDGEIFSALSVISGHTIKHLVAALGLWMLLLGYQKRDNS